MTWNIPPNYLFSLAEVAEVNTLNILFATGENFGEVKKLVSSVKAVFGQSSLLGVMKSFDLLLKPENFSSSALTFLKFNQNMKKSCIWLRQST